MRPNGLQEVQAACDFKEIEMKKELKAGDKIKFVGSFGNGHFAHAPITAEVVIGSRAMMTIKIDGKDSYIHGRQVTHRINPKQKTVRVSREQLAKAWDENAAYNIIAGPSNKSETFKLLAKAIGLDSQ